MKLLLPALLLLVISFSVNAQNVVSDTSATVVAYWKKGEKKTFILDKIIEKKTRDRHVADSAKFLLTVTVLEESDKGYTLEWKYKIISMPGVPGMDIPGLESLCDNLRIEYKTDENGSFLELNNLEEMLAFMGKSYDLLLKGAKYPKDMELVLNELKKLVSSKESIENLLMKDVQLFHYLYGSEYNKRKQTEEVELMNVFGGDPYPATNDYQFAGYNKQDQTVRVDVHMLVDKKEATRIILAFLNETAKKMGKPGIKPEEFPQLNINDNYTFYIHAPTGWLKKANSVRLVDVMGSFKKETIILTSN